MWSFYFYLFASLGSILGSPKRLGLSEGNQCRLANGRTGTCQKFSECAPAVKELDESGQWPSKTLICDFQEFDPIICCDSSETTIKSTTTATTTSRATTLKRPLSKKPGVIAKKKCKEYSKWIEPPVLMDSAKKLQAGTCAINVEKFITGGYNASEQEFPHMVHLGYGTGQKTYKCGASLISNKYLLTAAHCLKLEHPTVAKLGWGDYRFSTIKKIVEVFTHPDFDPLQRYHDIAVLRMGDLLEFTDYMRPACIQFNQVIEEDEAIASGWGKTNISEEDGSNYLMKVNLTILDLKNCSETYTQDEMLLKRGLDPMTMLCAGDPQYFKDTCHGDSGGPLQIVMKKPHCMYSIVGVTSFGDGCGTAPGIYTKVYEYVPWIESIVWPDEVKKLNERVKRKKAKQRG